jgi:hypothetical protein
MLRTKEADVVKLDPLPTTLKYRSWQGNFISQAEAASGRNANRVKQWVVAALADGGALEDAGGVPNRLISLIRKLVNALKGLLKGHKDLILAQVEEEHDRALFKEMTEFSAVRILQLIHADCHRDMGTGQATALGMDFWGTFIRFWGDFDPVLKERKKEINQERKKPRKKEIKKPRKKESKKKRKKERNKERLKERLKERKKEIKKRKEERRKTERKKQRKKERKE